MHDITHRQLLCTFTDNKNFRKCAEAVREFYNLQTQKIFAFTNVKNAEEVYLTYNVVSAEKHAEKFPNTILIHRKKQTNTLYTLNSMNKLIEEENGVFDRNYIVKWELYVNSLIITNDVSVRIIPLKILNILD